MRLSAQFVCGGLESSPHFIGCAQLAAFGCLAVGLGKNVFSHGGFFQGGRHFSKACCRAWWQEVAMDDREG
jgi:hypothetical protein